MHKLFLLAVCFFILHSSVLFAEEVPVKLPPKLEKVVQATKATILKNYQSEIDKLSKELEKSKILATKAGNLNDAVMVDNLIKEIANDSLLAEIIKDNKKKSETDLLGNPLQNDNKKLIIGEWRRADMKDTYTFNSDGSISWGNPIGFYKGTWKVSKSKLIMSWTNPAEWGDQTLTYEKEILTSGEGWNMIKLKL